MHMLAYYLSWVLSLFFMASSIISLWKHYQRKYHSGVPRLVFIRRGVMYLFSLFLALLSGYFLLGYSYTKMTFTHILAYFLAGVALPLCIMSVIVSFWHNCHENYHSDFSLFIKTSIACAFVLSLTLLFEYLALIHM